MMKRSELGLDPLLMLLIVLATCLLPAGRPVGAADLPIYADSLAPGWVDWSWNTRRDFSNGSPTHGGAKSISVTFNAAWGGLYLHADPSIDLSGYEHLSFWIFGSATGNQSLRVVANGDGSHVFQVATQANVWTAVNIPFSDLGSPSTLADLYWQDTTGATQPVFYLDDITLVGKTGTPPPPVSAGPDLSIDASASRHSISQGIYGMNYAAEELAAELHLPVRRWGGNSTSRYNWRNDTHNTGSDWYFENIPENNPSPAMLPDGSAADRFVEQNQRTGTATLMTVPLIGWVPKQRLENHPYDCGFKVSKYGAQQSVDPWDTQCGNGVFPNGSNLTGNSPFDTSAAIGPEFISAWIRHLTGKYGTAANGGVGYYNLDNEPMLWNSTHRDVHPQPVTYDEIRDRTYQYAAAIKFADPSAETLGPVLWGWCAYFYSALDGCGIGPDYQSHANTPFVAWYLQQMRLYEQQNGVRILDYLDLHYYPQAGGVSLGAAGNASTQALRLRSTRSLWDPTYKDESWISDMESGGVAVRLIPRMKEWVNAYYPGTKLAITEYNWGGLESINGALAQADVLGIFGREGLDLATLWAAPAATQPGAFAFRIYRNYDGGGHGFGDASVQASSENQGQLAVYAAQRSTDNALTVMVINKTANGLTSNISLSGFTPKPQAAVYRYSAAKLGGIEHSVDQPVTSNGFSSTFPSTSITLFVIESADTGHRVLTITKTGTGRGSVSPDSGAITWVGSTGSGTYPNETVVSLSASAESGSVFVGWAGCDSIAASSCNVAMKSDKAVTATFSDIQAPAGAITINSGAVYTKTAAVGLNLSATDNSGAVAFMQFSGNNIDWTGWESHSLLKNFVLSVGDGEKTVYARFKDVANNVSTASSDSIILDTKKPIDGTLKLTALSGKMIQAEWSGFSDATSGILDYRLMASTTGMPPSCSGMPIYNGKETVFMHKGLAARKTYYYRVCATDKALNISSGATGKRASLR